MKFEYMMETEKILPYYQFPKFLLELPLSQNAKILYMLLYDRARISQKNHWLNEDGYGYFIFLIIEISLKWEKCPPFSLLQNQVRLKILKSRQAQK